MKIAIIGYSGSGKSTLAKILSKHYNTPVLFMDRLNFLPNWELRNREEGKLITKEFMKNESWVIDGNYSDFYQKERLEVADKIIFFNFPRRICLYRAYKRYFENRNTTREDMADGCIEKIDAEFTWWIIHKGRNKEKRNHYKKIEKDYKDKIVVLKRPKDLQDYLKSIGISN